MHRVSLKGKKYHTSEAGIENFTQIVERPFTNVPYKVTYVQRYRKSFFLYTYIIVKQNLFAKNKFNL